MAVTPVDGGLFMATILGCCAPMYEARACAWPIRNPNCSSCTAVKEAIACLLVKPLLISASALLGAAAADIKWTSANSVRKDWMSFSFTASSGFFT